jgi:hypothetical protein
VYSCLVGLVKLIGRLSAMNLAKSLIVSEKNYSNHRAPMRWNGSFWPKISPIFAFRHDGSIRYSRAKHAVHSYLGYRTTAHIEYLMGSTVNNLVKFWVYKLSYLKRHPSVQKARYWNTAHLLRYKRKLLPLNAPRLIDQADTGRRQDQIPD